MANSMTGLGVGEVQLDKTTVVVELKSVNNRFLDVSCRIPTSLSYYERDVRDIIRTKIQRGKLYVNISIQGENNGVIDLRVDPKIAKAVRCLLEDLQKATGIREKLRLEHFIKFSEIFESCGGSREVEEIWYGVKDALVKALDSLYKMRKEEGDTITKDILFRIESLAQHVDNIEQEAKANLTGTYSKMVESANKLMVDNAVDKDRLYTELAIMANKVDVTEECVRLKSHNQLFINTIRNESVVGKKLNFILQEMNREVNTISSKANNISISHHVVEMKEEIEKLREQIQNLE
jgi:uncharacterized protein (TIGR00255 family)